MELDSTGMDPDLDPDCVACGYESGSEASSHIYSQKKFKTLKYFILFMK
jgi:hypothetical protein